MKIGTSQKVAPSACTACGKVLDGCSSVDGEHKPKPGDITVCISCGHLMAFADDLTMRDLTDEEMHAIAGDPRIIAIQRARKAVMSKKGAAA